MSYEVLKSDPGNPVFAEYAEALRQQFRSLEAIEVCLRGLSANPSCHRGRLVLARLYFERGYYPFAAREVNVLRETLPQLASLEKLYRKFYPESGDLEDQDTETTVAETDFEISELELAGEERKK